ncbi:hypothetical protein NQ317_007958, partial [Molorchus minor]
FFVAFSSSLEASQKTSRRRIWLCLRGFGGDQPLPNLAYLCLSHFKPEDMLISSTGSKRYLKPDAFPFPLPFPKISDGMPCRPSTSECGKGSEPHLIQSSTSLTSTASKAEEQMLNWLKSLHHRKQRILWGQILDLKEFFYVSIQKKSNKV